MAGHLTTAAAGLLLAVGVATAPAACSPAPTSAPQPTLDSGTQSDLRDLERCVMQAGPGDQSACGANWGPGRHHVVICTNGSRIEYVGDDYPAAAYCANDEPGAGVRSDQVTPGQ